MAIKYVHDGKDSVNSSGRPEYRAFSTSRQSEWYRHNYQKLQLIVNVIPIVSIDHPVTSAFRTVTAHSPRTPLQSPTLGSGSEPKVRGKGA